MGPQASRLNDVDAVVHIVDRLGSATLCRVLPGHRIAAPDGHTSSPGKPAYESRRYISFDRCVPAS